MLNRREAIKAFVAIPSVWMIPELEQNAQELEVVQFSNYIGPYTGTYVDADNQIGIYKSNIIDASWANDVVDRLSESYDKFTSSISSRIFTRETVTCWLSQSQPEWFHSDDNNKNMYYGKVILVRNRHITDNKIEREFFYLCKTDDSIKGLMWIA